METNSKKERICILIVDDCALTRRMVADILRPDGYNLTLGSGPMGTGVMIIQNRPRVALIDINMPGVSGPELIKANRKLADEKGTRLLLFSALTEAELESIQKECGADGYIRKTKNYANLREEIKKWL